MPRFHFDRGRLFTISVVILALSSAASLPAALSLRSEVRHAKHAVDNNSELLVKGRQERIQYQYEDRILSCTGIRLADPKGADEPPVNGICEDVPKTGQPTTTLPEVTDG